MKTLLCTLMLAVAGAAAAKADAVTIVFHQPNQLALPGDTLQFFGTITNNSSDTVFLNSDDFTLAGMNFSIDDLFFSNVPISLDPNTNSGDIELFDVTVSDPLLDPLANYLGTYDLVGGIDGNAMDVLGSAEFSITTVPEPSAIFLLLGVSLITFFPIFKAARARQHVR